MVLCANQRSICYMVKLKIISRSWRINTPHAARARDIEANLCLSGNVFNNSFSEFIRNYVREPSNESLWLITNSVSLQTRFPKSSYVVRPHIPTLRTSSVLTLPYLYIPPTSSHMTSRGLFNSTLLYRAVQDCYKFSSSKMAARNLSVGEKAVEKPWHAPYPAPKTTAAAITRESLLSWMLEGKIAGKDFVLVDLRRTDFEVCPNNFIIGLSTMASM